MNIKIGHDSKEEPKEFSRRINLMLLSAALISICFAAAAFIAGILVANWYLAKH